MDTSTRQPDSASSRLEIEPGYQSGFANEFATEALPGALPAGRNSPQRVAYGLYAEQLSGTAFTAPRGHNRRRGCTASVRRRCTSRSPPLPSERLVANFADVPPTPPNQLRWDACPPMPTVPTDFIDGWVTMGGNGAARRSTSGCGDPPVRGEPLDARPLFLQRRRRTADRAAGRTPAYGHRTGPACDVEPLEIARDSTRRALRASSLPDGAARGYICENFGAPLRLPELGPIGSNGLANPRDFHDAGRRVRRRRRRLRTRRENRTAALWRADIEPFAARRGGLARQLRAVQVRSAPLQHDRTRSASTIRTRRFSRC